MGHRLPAGLFEPVTVDLFAGFGGTSLGLERGTGRAPDVAINHCAIALGFHERNHPHTWHVRGDVWAADPVKVTGGRPVGLLWASPDCRHFSRAKGSAPVSKRVRSLAWVVTRWARLVRPAVIMVENVREFLTWGPVRDGRPIKERMGETFKRWVGQLQRLGYTVEWRVLNAADYGAPTHRRRLFVIARRDGQAIRWPEKTHGAGLRRYRTAAECIDWSIPCPSIFDRKKPLAEKTLKRIALGLKRYVLENPRPFIVNIERSMGGYPGKSVDEPLGVITAHPKGGKHALVSPVLVGVDRAMACAWLVKHYTGMVGHLPERPLGSITQIDHHSIAAAHLVKFYGTGIAGGVDGPLHPVTSQGNKAGLVYAFLTKYFGCGVGQGVDEPAHTITGKDRFGLVVVQVNGEPHVVVDIGLRMLSPRELARCQGFPDSYILPSVKRHAVRLIGNSVSPPMAEALVRANLPPAPVKGRAVA